jgi:IS30 family transposase
VNIAVEINDGPRKTLNWSRPADVFASTLAAATSALRLA